ncbi:MAG: hypothetical protein KGN16_01110 [Burkholderiales bacterium]|nr:hypothetical protein [Burkholderiales bacterium]
MATLERRIEAMEQMGAARSNGIAVIARQVISPGGLEPDNGACDMEGATYARGLHESSDEFEGRMMATAEGLSRSQGRSIRIIFSPAALAT